jgi:hypothetical protein
MSKDEVKANKRGQKRKPEQVLIFNCLWIITVSIAQTSKEQSAEKKAKKITVQTVVI